MRARSAVLLTALLAACGLDVVGITPGAIAPGEDASASPSSSSSSSTSSSSSSSGDLPEGGTDGGFDADATVAPDPCVPSAHLLLCLQFEGSVIDRSQKPRVVSAQNLQYVGGRTGQAGRFALNPKTNVQIASFADFNTAATSMELWVNPASYPQNGAQMILIDIQGRFAIYLNSDGTISCRTTLKLTTKLPLGQWTHVACVHDGAHLLGYTNGVVENQEDNTLAAPTDFIGIGQDSPSLDRGFDGSLDDFRIWDEVRTAQQVLAAAR